MRWTKVCGLDRWLRRGDGLMPPSACRTSLATALRPSAGIRRLLSRSLRPAARPERAGHRLRLRTHGHPLVGPPGPARPLRRLRHRADLILWCAGNLTPRNANFTFHLANIHNKHYNPHGTCRASEYRFPCGTRASTSSSPLRCSRTCCPTTCGTTSTSIRRVLRPGGRGLLTHFILNADSESAMNRTTEGLKFRFLRGDCFAAEADDPQLHAQSNTQQLICR